MVKVPSNDTRARRYMDYHIEPNAMRRGMDIERFCATLNRLIGWQAATVERLHKTLVRVRGVPRKVLVTFLSRLLERHGSVFIARRRGLAANWVFRPSANRPLVRC